MVALENGRFVLRRRNPRAVESWLRRPGVQRMALLTVLFACTQLFNGTDLLKSSRSADDLLLLEVAEEANVKPAVFGIDGSTGVPANESRQPDKVEDDAATNVSANGNGNSTTDSDEHPTNDSEVSPKDDDDGAN
mmetsp:Transcript_1050/g.2234  ORF Transcript_1050/g.2234 Transcript_1050/m.2234 type:complete len:135 (-) Transcript_1050:278-682(-)